MDKDLRDLITKIETGSKYKVSFALYCTDIGVIDSDIFDDYYWASVLCSKDSEGNTEVIPVIVEKEEDDYDNRCTDCPMFEPHIDDMSPLECDKLVKVGELRVHRYNCSKYLCNNGTCVNYR